MTGRPLSPEQAGDVYDRIGRLQDWQAFYEGPAIRDLEAHGGFGSARAVLELGCGTGAFARRLLTDLLPDDATYLGVDVSPRMVRLASARLRPFGERAEVRQVSGRPPLPGADGAYDRVVAVYVVDLLPEALARDLLAESARVLTRDGRLCLVSLTTGATPAARAVCAAWTAVWERSPALVGGCRPTDLLPLLGGDWRVAHAANVTAWAVTSQVVVATPGDARGAR